jgi:hypothetical protein
MQVRFGERGGSIFAFFDVADKFGGRDPTFGVHVINGKLHTLSVVLGEQMDMFATDFDYSPHALSQQE